MTSFSLTKHIAAPVEVVFDVASDLPHAAEYIRGIERIEMLTPPPVGIGSKWRETRTMMGRSSTETLEVTAFDRPRSYTVGCDSCGAHFETTFRFATVESGTELTLDAGMESRTLMAKLMSPLGNLMFGKALRKCMEDDLDDVKSIAEQRAVTP